MPPHTRITKSELKPILLQLTWTKDLGANQSHAPATYPDSSFCCCKVQLKAIYSCLISLHCLDLQPCVDLYPKSAPSDLPLTLMKSGRQSFVLHTCTSMHVCFFTSSPSPPFSFLAPLCYISPIEIKVMSGQGKRMFFQQIIREIGLPGPLKAFSNAELRPGLVVC